jgi:hypothetical protein
MEPFPLPTRHFCPLNKSQSLNFFFNHQMPVLGAWTYQILPRNYTTNLVDFSFKTQLRTIYNFMSLCPTEHT